MFTQVAEAFGAYIVEGQGYRKRTRVLGEGGELSDHGTLWKRAFFTERRALAFIAAGRSPYLASHGVRYCGEGPQHDLELKTREGKKFIVDDRSPFSLM
jgi:hypothetical protein